MGLCSHADFFLQAGSERFGDLGVLGEGIDKRVLPVDQVVDLVRAGHCLDDPAHDDAVHHGSYEHRESDVDDLSLSSRRDVAEAHGREDRHDEVVCDQPLLFWRLRQERGAVDVDAATPDPRRLGVVVQGRSEVPEACEDVTRPHQANDEVDHADSPEALEPPPPRVAQVEQLGEACQAYEPSQPRHALHPGHARNPVDVVPVFPVKKGLDGFFGDARQHVRPEEARQVLLGDELQIVNLGARTVLVGEKEVDEQVGHEDVADGSLGDLPAYVVDPNGVRTVLVDVERAEAESIEEDGGRVYQEHRDHQGPDMAREVVLVQDEGGAPVAAPVLLLVVLLHGVGHVLRDLALHALV
mmetsp:Transcript_27256/g.85115  ORF Transcript_27256/g.85115 Transcript_27256/m.85115 type:complete len:355 (-) Transcript_27256:73-1137(-)